MPEEVLENGFVDSQNMLGSIDMLSQQMGHAWAHAGETAVATASFDKVVLFGMGGSALGMDVAHRYLEETVAIPLLIHNDYSTPAYITENTLVILSSYSGTTEEVLSVAKTITEHTQHIAVVTTGGKLAGLAEANSWPAYIIDPKYNPCGQPRIAIGYGLMGLLRLLTLYGVCEVSDQEVDDAIHFVEGNRELLRDDAIELAKKVRESIPVFIASEFLLGNAHIVTNQVNENGKHYATYAALPEINHHLLEGLGNPSSARSLHFVFMESFLYHQRNQKRYAVTKDVLDKNSLAYSQFVATGKNAFIQIFEALQWGSYLSYYIAEQNEIDPSPIPWVDYFKQALKRPIA